MSIPTENHLLNYLVEECRTFMFREFYPLHFGKLSSIEDFDIHIAVILENGDWEIMLSMAASPDKMYQFISKHDSNRIEVVTHVKAHVLTIDRTQFC